jgi:hypothetical protein
VKEGGLRISKSLKRWPTKDFLHIDKEGSLSKCGGHASKNFSFLEESDI